MATKGKCTEKPPRRGPNDCKSKFLYEKRWNKS